MKIVKKIALLLIVFTFTLSVKAQDKMFIYKDGAIIGEHVLAEVDSVIFYQPTQGNVMDNDGNEYQTVVIGTQTWMAENLKTTTYNDGTAIQNVTDAAVWSNTTSGAYGWHDNNEASYREPYGALFNWYAVETAKLCPVGWHVPTDADWTVLINFLGGTEIAGAKLKETETMHWDYPNEGATNEVGFNAVAGGSRFNALGAFGDIGYYWSSTSEGDFCYLQVLYSNYAKIDRFMYDKPQGFSVRCIKN